ncbi:MULTISPECIES: RNA polymerase sigma factor [unclassified Aureispira]|uniref:RNA polymerase sigma factor n=1 Tax=unclassified Aureispira TaxID=2649989 RepID=UPI0006987DA6|nr:MULTISPECIES: sigma-70 family RNA polymerase sigma factor [unclassified Aureispira]WMX14036.1 sigma-70 family RNA polymerase sigma factor [Aureispira sp. CCB-E]
MTTIDFNEELSKLEEALSKFAYKLTKNKDDAKDLYQETAYRALTNQNKFRVGTNLKAWLFTMMRNIFINNYRKKVKRNTILDSTDDRFHLNSSGPAIVNDADSSIMMKELQNLMDKLEDHIRVPFLMYYYGYKYQEIAEQLDVPLGTVKSRIFFARQELKDAILKNYKEVLNRTRTA